MFQMNELIYVAFLGVGAAWWTSAQFLANFKILRKVLS